MSDTISGFIEYYKKKKQGSDSEQEESNQEAENNHKDDERVQGFISYYNSKKAPQVAQEIVARANQWLTDTDTLFGEYNTRYSGDNTAYRGDATDYFNSIADKTTALNTEAESILALIKEYGDYYDDDWKQSVTDMLSATSLGRRQMNDIVMRSYEDQQFWSKWKNEDDYLTKGVPALQNAKYYAEYGDMDENTYNRELEKVKSQYDEITNSYAGQVGPVYYPEDISARYDYLKQYGEQKAPYWYDLEAGAAEIAELESELKEFERLNLQIIQRETAYAQAGMDNPRELAESDYDLQGVVARIKEISEKYGVNAFQGELSSLLAEKKVLYRDAEKAQNLAKLSSVSDEKSESYDPNFAVKAQYIPEYTGDVEDFASRVLSGDADLQYLIINDRSTYDELVSALEEKLSSGTATPEEIDLIENIYVDYSLIQHMSDDEKKLYNYYYSVGGKKAADEFLKAIETNLKYLESARIADKLHDKPVLKRLYGVQVGLDQFASGMQGLFTDEYIEPSVTQYAGQKVREDLADEGIFKWYNIKTGRWEDKFFGSSSAQMLYDVGQTGANMLPSILVAAAVEALLPTVGEGAVLFGGLTASKLAGATVLGASAAGNAKNEMLEMGYSLDQARAYATMVGLSEAGLEMLLGGIPGLGGDGIFSGLGEKIIGKVDHAIAKAAIALGGNMLDEGLEEGLQTVLENWFKEISTGVDFDDPAIDEILYSSLLGALTAAGFGGKKLVGAARSSVKSSVDQAIKTTRTGKKYKSQYGTDGVKALVSQGIEYNGTAAQKLAEKLQGKLDKGKKVSNYLVGKLYLGMSESQIKSSFSKKGIASDIADALTSVVRGKQISNADLKKIINNEVALGELNTILGTSISKDSDIKSVRERISTAYEAQTDSLVAELDKNQDAMRSLLKGEIVSDKAIKEILKDEKAREVLNLRTGAEITETSSVQEVKEAVIEASNDNYRAKAAATLALSLGMGTNGIRGIAGIAANSALDVSRAVQAFNTVYQLGVQGKAMSDAKNPYLSELTMAQRLAAYEYGVMDGLMAKSEAATVSKKESVAQNGKAKTTLLDADKIAEMQKKIDNAEKLQSRKEGKVIYEGDRTKLSSLQKRSLHALESISKALGVTFHIFESQEVDGKRVAKVNGKETSANGWYDTKTGEIWIDINAGINGDGLIIWTASHELTHFIKQWSPEKFKVFADFLLENYAERGISIDNRIDKQIEKAKKNGREISRDEALEEVIADSCETFLLDSNAAEKIIELRNKDKGLAQKILGFLRKALRDIKAMLKGVQPESYEGKLVSEMTGTLQQLHDLWADALADASEAYSGAESVVNSEGSVKEQAREYGDKNLYKDGEVYSYDFMTSQPPMEVRTLPSLSTVKENGKVSQEKAVSLGLDNAKSIGKTIGEKQVIVTNKYTGREITIGQKSLNHSLDASQIHRLRTNARLSSIGGYIVQNAIPVNGLKKENPQANGTYAMACLLKDGEGYVVAIVTVDEFSSNAIGIDFVEITHSINGRFVKKEDSRSSTRESELGQKSISATATFDISIADFLDIVNSSHQSILSDDVLSHFDAERNPSGHYTNRVLFSDRDPDALTNREILANMLDSVAESDRDKAFLDKYKARLEQIEKDKAEIARLKEEKKGTEKLRREVITSKIEKLEKGITESEKWLKNLEETATLKRLVSKEREAMYAEGVLAGQMAQGKADAKVIRKQQEKLDKEKQKRADMRSDMQQKAKESKSEAVARERQKRADMLAEYRARVAEREQRIKEKYQEAREKSIEGRNKTEVRNKIKRVVAKLHRLLTSDSREKHVPSGLKTVVADALSIINMDTVGAEKRIKEYDERIAKATDPIVKESLINTRNEIEAQGVRFAEKIAKLQDAYAQIKKDASADVRSVYSEDIEEYIKAVREQVGDTSIKDMDIDQLEAVYEMFTIILKNVRDGNKLFLEGRSQTVAENSMAVDLELEQNGKSNKLVSKNGKLLKKFGWSLLKPVTFMKTLGSKTFTKLYENIRKGEDTWAVDVNEAKDFFSEMRDKYKFDSWDLEKKYDFADDVGNKFSLTVEQIMSLYAYSKRDKADLHLKKGGFVFDSSITVKKKNKLGIPVEYYVNDATPYRLSKETVKGIASKLSKDMTDFVDEMQAYLSDVMGEKGNEISMKMYDIRLFKEKNYFPLKTSQYFREFDPEKGATPKIKNSGFTHKTMPGANNPIILSNFMDVWANHVNDMSMYHAFTLPTEDFMKVYNYNSREDGFSAIKQKISQYYGDEANKYIQTLIDQLNSGARSDPDASLVSRGIAAFKKAKTFVSASVVIQQPSALARAWAYIDPKYFVDKPKATSHDKTWAELKKHAPVAIIKEMGRFDSNMGRSTADYIMKRDYKTIKEKATGIFTDKEYRDDVLSKAPALADELAWCAIWKAVKREIAATTDLEVNSTEYFERCGERFTEIIENTQVYDSVLAKSEIMRSKDSGLKMVTAFAAEPITTLNMMVDAIVEGKRGRKSFARRSVGAVAASIVLNSILVSIVYAARDDDEDETYAEKYLASLTAELVDGFNPLTYIPLVRDIWSVMQGYDIERTDMSMIGDIWNSVEGLFSTSKSGFDKVSDLVGNIAAIFGVPADNIMRDAKAIYNVGELIYNKNVNDLSTTKWGVRDAVMEALKNVTPLWSKIESYTGNKRTKYDELYEAMMSGDETYIKRAQSHFTEDDLESGIKRGLKDNDVRIEEAARAYLKGDVRRFGEIIDTIAAEGIFDSELVESVVRSEINKLKPDTVTEETVEAATSIYKVADINIALNSGDVDAALNILSELIEVKSINNEEKIRKEAEEEGKTLSTLEILASAEYDARSSIRSSITSYWKPLYVEASKAGNQDEMGRIYDILLKTGLYGNWRDLEKTLKDWRK